MNAYPQIHAQLEELRQKYPGQRCGIWTEYNGSGTIEYTARVDNAFGQGHSIEEALQSLKPKVRTKEQVRENQIRTLEQQLADLKAKATL